MANPLQRIKYRGIGRNFMSTGTDHPPVVFTDADNTLWDTDGLFAAAQLDLLNTVERTIGLSVDSDRLTFVRQLDQMLAAEHHQGLRYPVRLLAIAVTYALQGETPTKAAQRAWREVTLPSVLGGDFLSKVEAKFIADVRALPAALPGVVDGLKLLERASAHIYVLSEGDRTKVALRLAHIGSPDLVQSVIEAPKSADLFRRVGKLAGGATSHSWMIGDQLTRDIQPARAAGLRTIYIPSRFRPIWELASEDIKPDYTAATFAEAVTIILQ